MEGGNQPLFLSPPSSQRERERVIRTLSLYLTNAAAHNLESPPRTRLAVAIWYRTQSEMCQSGGEREREGQTFWRSLRSGAAPKMTATAETSAPPSEIAFFFLSLPFLPPPLPSLPAASLFVCAHFLLQGNAREREHGKWGLKAVCARRVANFPVSLPGAGDPLKNEHRGLGLLSRKLLGERRRARRC